MNKFLFNHYLCFFTLMFGMEMGKDRAKANFFRTADIDQLNEMLHEWTKEFLDGDEDSQDFFDQKFSEWWKEQKQKKHR